MSAATTPVIVGTRRTAFARAFGAYSEVSNLDMMVHVLDALATDYNLAPNAIDMVIAGAVASHARDWNIAREAVVRSKLGNSVSGITSTIACGTSLQNALAVAAKIRTGEIDAGIAAGSDTISDSPIAVSKKLNSRLIRASRARSTGERLKTLSKGFSLGELAPAAMSVNEPMTGLSMGQHTELMAKQWGISREDQDQWAVNSHLRAAAAFERGEHDALIAPIANLHRDDNLRPHTSVDEMAKLRPAFDRKNGTLSAGNSTPLSDGAAAVLIASEAWAKEHDLPILAYIRGGQVAAMDYVEGEGLLIAPALAIANMLKRNTLSLSDFDLFEIHEAFAAQVLSTLAALEDEDFCVNKLGASAAIGTIDRSLINPWGSSLAYGHPFAATGARVLGVAAAQIARGDANRALLSVCTAGGQGVVAVLEAKAK